MCVTGIDNYDLNTEEIILTTWILFNVPTHFYFKMHNLKVV